MRIFVPYTHLEEATAGCLIPYSFTAAPILDLDFGYFDYWRWRWRDGETFVNVEHDIVFHRGAIEALAECPGDWCCFPYDGGADSLCMGLMKVTDRLIVAHPKVFECDPVPYTHVATHLAESVGRLPHQHFPAVLNL